MEQTLYNQKGKEAGKITLPENIFAVPWNADLVHQVVTSMMGNKRSGTADTKGRGEVRGGGKKPWRQKGTGRARHGSSRSPIWKGGGITHGPKSEKNYKRKINKKMKNKALFTVLSAKAKSNQILFIDALSIGGKTKDAHTIMQAFGGIKGFDRVIKNTKRQTALVIPTLLPELTRSFRNLPTVAIEETKELNPMTLLSYKYLIFVDPEKTFSILDAKTKAK